MSALNQYNQALNDTSIRFQNATGPLALAVAKRERDAREIATAHIEALQNRHLLSENELDRAFSRKWHAVMSDLLQRFDSAAAAAAQEQDSAMRNAFEQYQAAKNRP